MRTINLFNKRPASPRNWDDLTAAQYRRVTDLALLADDSTEEGQIDSTCGLLAILHSTTKEFWLTRPIDQVSAAYKDVLRGDILRKAAPHYWQRAPHPKYKAAHTLSTGAAIMMQQAINTATVDKPFDMWITLVAIWLQMKDGCPPSMDYIDTYLLQAEGMPASEVWAAGFFMQKVCNENLRRWAVANPQHLSSLQPG